MAPHRAWAAIRQDRADLTQESAMEVTRPARVTPRRGGVAGAAHPDKIKAIKNNSAPISAGEIGE